MASRSVAVAIPETRKVGYNRLYAAEGNSEMLMNRSNLKIFEIGFRRMSKTLECISICPFAFIASKLITKVPSLSKSNIIVHGV